MLKGLATFVVAYLLTTGVFGGQTAMLTTPVANNAGGENENGQGPGSSGVKTISTCDESCQQGRQNLAIQHNLEWFTFALAVVGFLQVGTMIWQAVLLKGTLVKVGEQSATAQDTLFAIKTQAGLMEQQSTLMAEQGRFAIKQLELTKRPWIAAQLRLGTKLLFTTEGIQIGVDILLENIGETPAIGIWSEPMFYVANLNKPHPIIERARLCEEIIKRHPDWGHIIFPGEKRQRQMIINAPIRDIEAAGGEAYSASIILVVAYRSTLDEAARYYTGVIYDLHRLDPDNPNINLSLTFGESIPLELIRCAMSPVAAIIAK